MMPVNFRAWKPSIPRIITTDYSGPPMPPGTILESIDGIVCVHGDSGADNPWMIADGFSTGGFYTEAEIIGRGPWLVLRYGRPEEPLGADSPLAHLGYQVHATAVAHGWWNGEPTVSRTTPSYPDRNVGEALMLMVCELAEVMEAFRDTDGTILALRQYTMKWDDKSQVHKPDGFPIELADVLIRLLDFCYGMGIDLDHMVHLKMEYNKERPFKHGGKIA
jgi:hypothetical protein